MFFRFRRMLLKVLGRMFLIVVFLVNKRVVWADLGKDKWNKKKEKTNTYILLHGLWVHTIRFDERRKYHELGESENGSYERAITMQ